MKPDETLRQSTKRRRNIRIDGDEMFRLSKSGSGEKRELEEKRTSLKKDQGERHTSIASNRRPLVRSSPGSWTEPNRRTKKCKKETLGFKKSWQSGSGGPEKKYRKGQRQLGAKRKLTSVNSNDLLYFRKRYRRERKQ
ncbi:hypothetical protein TNCV_2371801 [Trichonephila clavipes]|nr:hypothetical protein TNCV_2371801 [Trichonephila clavipes]